MKSRSAPAATKSGISRSCSAGFSQPVLIFTLRGKRPIRLRMAAMISAASSGVFRMPPPAPPEVTLRLGHPQLRLMPATPRSRKRAAASAMGSGAVPMSWTVTGIPEVANGSRKAVRILFLGQLLEIRRNGVIQRVVSWRAEAARMNSGDMAPSIGPGQISNGSAIAE